MEHKFVKDIPYHFKDVTGLSKDDNIGYSITGDGKVVGGIISYIMDIPVPIMGSTFKCITICGIEILPEYRNKGIGTAVVKHLLTECQCINAAVQDEKAWDWWRKMGAEQYMAVVFPEDMGKENPRAHTLAFVLGKTERDTKLFRGLFQMLTSQIEGVTQLKEPPQVDFSVNKNL